MVTELLVRLKSIFSELGDLIHLANGATNWSTVVRISPERAEALADVCAKIRPMLSELGDLLDVVEERARLEAERLK